MSSERDRARRLAEEVRAAIAETAPSGVARVETEPGNPDERAARAASSRAGAHVMPTVPAGAQLARVKRGAIRALRFVWRDQASFNALLLEIVESLRQALSRDRRDAGERLRRIEKSIAASNAAAERRAAIQDGRLAALESTGTPEAAARPGGAAETPAMPSLPPGVYSLFEERFRGRAEDVQAKQRFYLPLFENLPGPVIDVGCGRGEFLKLLRSAEVSASGVETNPIAVAHGRQEGLDIREGDGVADLAAHPAGTAGAVTAFQVVEHWTPETIFAFLRAARRALAPGGLLVAETINTDSLSAWRAFFLDPSHVRPVPAEALRFLAETAGFTDARIEYLAPLPASERLEERSENDRVLNRLLFAPQDYALIARVPGEGA
ncbi:MAG: class I SAM-dependent methyltransferase [Acidobacteriota bacterium]